MQQMTSVRPAQHIRRASRHEAWDGPENVAAGVAADVATGVAIESTFRRLSRQEAADLRAQEPAVSPWRVVAVQTVVGVGAALIGALITGNAAVGWSVLYGAATVALPAALMARGMTSKLSSIAPGASAVSFMLWEFVKIGVSLAMLVVAGRIVQPLVWPALLVGLVVCMKVYWVALLWRNRKTSSVNETKNHGS